jgi:hypothetical protein
MRLVRKNNAWQIVGAAAHRARIAYATLEGERVVYSFACEFHPHEVTTLAGSQASPPKASCLT